MKGLVQTSVERKEDYKFIFKFVPHLQILIEQKD